MKINQIIMRAVAVTFLFGKAGCSGSQKEAKDDHQGHDMDKAAAPETMAEVKAFENVDAAVKSQINGFLTDYFALNKALIEDNQDGAKAAAKK